MYPRPTFLCIKGYWQSSVPLIEEFLLHDIDNSYLAAVRSVGNGRKRITSLDDNMFYSVDAGRFRVIFWEEDENPEKIWIVATGIRKEGSPEDIYNVLKYKAHLALNAERKKTPNFLANKAAYTNFLLPTSDDYLRLEIEKEHAEQKKYIAEFNENISICKMQKNKLIYSSANKVYYEIIYLDNENVSPEIRIGFKKEDMGTLEKLLIIGELERLVEYNELFSPDALGSPLPGSKLNSLTGDFYYSGILT